MINMMQALRKEVTPADYAACVFDAKGPTFRDALYPEYKAQRSAHARRPAQPDRAHPRGGAPAGLEGAGRARRGGRRRDRHPGPHGARQGIDVIVSSGDKDLANWSTSTSPSSTP
jgi:DNA polymerase-1